MDIKTLRFGTIEVEPADIIHFPNGILGMESLREWVLLADAENDALGWLQNAERPEIALAVVSPRRFVPQYQIRVARQELSALKLDQNNDGQVLVVVGKNERGTTLNLKAPLVFNLQRNLGTQVVAKDDQPLQYQLATDTAPLKKTA